MGLYLAEYLEPVSDPAGLRRCLDVREVRWLRRWVSRERERAREVNLFEAESAERVRDSHRSSGVAFAALWAAEEMPPPP